jgi:mono/diheme cytochrome c family protein
MVRRIDFPRATEWTTSTMISSGSEMPTAVRILSGFLSLIAVAAPIRAEDRSGIAAARNAGSAPIDFNREIRPILSENCFACHGPDEKTRKADLRLDTREGAFAVRDGIAAIVAGRPDDSELVLRIEGPDATLRMPPVKSGKKLSPAQIALLRRWIDQGAEWRTHWAFEPPQRPALPVVRDLAWCRNPIDLFVLAQLEARGLQPSPEAAKETLLRRVTLDLTGLPPTIAEIDAYLEDDSPGAYERVVDRLLNSAHYGERMALDWLDAARYADTNGYFSDLERSNWPWRDWVIDAFNANMPFDRFTIEQLAGDLLPQPARSQLVATGFHRNQPVTNETGAIDEEYRVEYVADRVDTTATVWLGLTMGCARCHDHKYDPLSQREYYRLFAFFNQGPEKGVVTQDTPPPVLAVPTTAQVQLGEELERQRAECERDYARHEPAVSTALAAWEATVEDNWPVPPADHLADAFDFDDRLTNGVSGSPDVAASGPLEFGPGILGQSLQLDGAQYPEAAGSLSMRAGEPWSVSVWFRADGKSSLGCILSKVEPEGDRRGFEIILRKQYVAINLIHRWGRHAVETITGDTLATNQWHHLVVAHDGSLTAEGLHVYVDGARRDLRIDRDTLAEAGKPAGIENTQPWRIGRRDATLGFSGWIDELRLYSRVLTGAEAADIHRSGLIRSIVRTETAQRTAEQKRRLLEAFLPQYDDPAAAVAWKALTAARQREAEYRAAIPVTMIARDQEQPRDTFVLERGQYDKPGERVSAGVPSVMPALPADRLALAQWLVHPEHPLTSRVTVNRLWQQFFGAGLVRSVNDFGSQGEPPTHPALLDLLASEFVRTGWDVKALIRQIVTSATYRQSSHRSVELERLDPENRWLSRGPRFRLTAEIIRDQALAAGGLLARELGGPSVKPYQPAGLWEAVSYGADTSYSADRGSSLYRRSLYTYWKRQAPPPAMLAFDAPTRETCMVARSRTNTPLQALVVLNDPTYIEAARALAADLMKSHKAPDRIVTDGIRRILGRTPAETELTALRQLQTRRLDEFRRDTQAARSLIRVGDSSAPESLDPAELASWTIVLSVLMNLDETLTRP